MNCGQCQKEIPSFLSEVEINNQFVKVRFPDSNYWIGTPKRVDLPFCSAQCSLDYHEEGKKNE